MKKIFISFMFLFGTVYAVAQIQQDSVPSWRIYQKSFQSTKLDRRLYSIEEQRTKALEYLNTLRYKAGMSMLSSNSFLDTAAQNHSDFMAINNIIGHYESDSYSNFTGIAPVDRTVYAGYKSKSISENVSYGQIDVYESIDGLFSAIYHRFGFLSSTIDEIGIGVNGYFYTYDMGNSNLNTLCSGESFNGYGAYYIGVCADDDFKIENNTFNLAISDISQSNPSIIVWPYEDAEDIPPVFYEESPDPLPDFSVSGYPVSISFNEAFFETPPSLVSFTLEQDDGTLIVDTRLLDKDSDPNDHISAYEFALFPLHRLEWDSRYYAKVTYVADGTEESYNWSFTTRKLPYPYYRIDGALNSAFSVISGKTYAFYFVPQNGNDTIGGYQYHTEYNSGVTIDSGYIDANTIYITLDGPIGSEATFTFDNAQTLKLTLSSALSAEQNQTVTAVINANSGWTLLGALADINTSTLSQPGVKIIWTYRNGNWYAYSSDPQISTLISDEPTIGTVETIKEAEGFWIYKE